MSRVEDIDRYLRAYFASQYPSDARGEAHRVRPFVTISRQAGTGGHALAERIRDRFSRESDVALFGDWQVYDRTVCEIVAKDPAFTSSFDSLVEEEYRSKGNDFFHQMLRSTVDQKMVMNRVFLVVRTIADMGKAIIVGRGGSHVTRDMPSGVALRIVAPEEWRVAKVVETLGLSERDARARGRKRDADRARLIKAHFGVSIDDPTGYDVTWNLGSVTYDDIAEATVELVRSRARLD
jgi:cytidylate kinase